MINLYEIVEKAKLQLQKIYGHQVLNWEDENDYKMSGGNFGK